MALRYESELPTAEQYWGLFQTTGWNAEYHATPQELVTALPTAGIALPSTTTSIWLAWGAL
jgi:hypothetical protein